MTQRILKVERHSFFKGPLQTLRWTESSPEEVSDHEDRGGCGCTQDVAKRPDGEPNQISQNITLEDQDTEYHLASNWFVFGSMGRTPHGYFHFIDEKSVRIEIIPNEEVDQFFITTLYCGNEINTSRMFNGSSPSKLDLSKIDPDQIWLHDCGANGEAIRFLEDSGEIIAWKVALSHAYEIRKQIEPFAKDYTTPVEVLRERLEANRPMIDACVAFRELLALTYFNYTTTDLYAKGIEVRRESRKRK